MPGTIGEASTNRGWEPGFPAGPGVVARVATVVTHRPEALAVAAPDATLSYAQLWGRALALAQRLRSAGLGSDEPVALCLPRSAELVVGALGILAAGGCYVALDPAQPHERLRFATADSGARMVVAGSEATWCPPGVLVLAPASGAEPAARAPVYADPHEPAYAVYTSGSTGEPKGVLVEHASLLNLVDWHQRAFGLTFADRSTLLASPGFDASIWELWPCLTAGASVHVPPEALKTDPGALRDWLVGTGITVCFLPTPLAETVLELAWPPDAPLRFLLTGGDVLHHRPPPGLPFTLVNNYGVAEGAVVSTSGVVAPECDADPVPPSIGSAIDGVHLTVVDETGDAVAAGQPGELVISGVSVARGYLGRPELDRARFSGSGSERAYRTGDLVRARPDGELEYLGRIDDQIQVRGVRVEPGEIAAVLNRHPAVESSVVLASGRGDAAFLTGYVVAADTQQPEPAELQAHLRQRLPEHMIPRDFVLLDALPTTANGKVDRTALREHAVPDHARRHLLAPRNDPEAVIADIVAERLGMPQVGVDENFFLLGGHSMLGAQLIIRVSEQFGVEMSLRTLFEHPTVAEMAQEVERLLVEEISRMSEAELLRAAQPDEESG